MIGEAKRRVSRPGRPMLAVQPQCAARGAPPTGLTELFRFCFAPAAGEAQEDNVFALFIEPIGDGPREEAWYTAGEVDGGHAADIRFMESRFYLAAHLQTAVSTGQRIDDIVCHAYKRLLTLVRKRGYPHLLRVWNLFPDINAGCGDAERYRQFSLGRAVALDALGYRERHFPAGTAIGTDSGTPLTISLLAGKEPSHAVENPRQTSAYHYPRQFGPRSPSFSRAVLLELNGKHQLLVSGTASIVGHESYHDGSVGQQVNETFRNIEALMTRAAAQAKGKLAGCAGRDACFRLYLRRREDLPAAREALAAHLQANEQIVILRGDICRRELVLEVEAACAF